MKNSVALTMPSHPQFLSVVRAVTARMGRIAGMSEPVVEDVKLAVDEACANVIKHAYKGDADKKIVVKFRIRKRHFEVLVEDSGTKARPELIKGRDLDDVRPGGLGIHLIRRAFDIVEFDEKKPKGNRLRLIRTRKENNEY